MSIPYRAPRREQSRPRWRHHARFTGARPEPALRAWLLDPASLTARLRAVCPGRLRVRVLDQRWGRPRLDEARALGMRRDHQALIRQVQLLCDDRPWVFARTVVPRGTLTGRERRLAHLGTRPLGAVLFADPAMRRGPVELARFLPGEPLFELAVRGMEAAPAAIWGRRSVFHLGPKPLLVSEVFLTVPGPCRRRLRRSDRPR